MRKRRGFDANQFQPVFNNGDFCALVPRGVDMRQLCDLCIQHGKQPIIRELWHRYAESYKRGNDHLYQQRSTIFTLERMTLEQIESYRQSGRNLHRTSGLDAPTEPWVWHDELGSDDEPDGIDRGRDI